MDGNVGGWFGEWMGELQTDWWMYRIIHIARHSVGVWGSKSDYLTLKTVNREGTGSPGKSGVVQRNILITSVWNRIDRLHYSAQIESMGIRKYIDNESADKTNVTPGGLVPCFV
jgi:hypothetical protein